MIRRGRAPCRAAGARRLLPALAALPVLLLGACGGGSSSSAGGDPLLVRTIPATQHLELLRVPGLGRMLTDGDGRTLYMFPPDAQDAVRCTGPCAGTWPTFAVRDPDGIVAGAGVRSRLMGIMRDPTTGELVVTYDGQPLYRYAGDVRPGQLNGQGLFVDGGPWYVVDRGGNPVTTDLAPTERNRS